MVVQVSSKITYGLWASDGREVASAWLPWALGRHQARSCTPCVQVMVTGQLGILLVQHYLRVGAGRVQFEVIVSVYLLLGAKNLKCRTK